MNIQQSYISKKKAEAPVFITDNMKLQQAYHMALENLFEINTLPCPAEEYNKSGLWEAEPGLMIRAGGGYPTPWTRDASVNTMNAACFLEPEVAKNTLWAVCERNEDGLCFQMDNQSWDKIIWAAGAWRYYLATGDMEFLKNAYETVKNSMELLEQTRWNQKYQLFTGGSFFNDGITGYPQTLHEEGNESSFVGDHPDTENIMSTSTNCLYYHGYRVLERMAEIHGEMETSKQYKEKGEKLKTAINRFLWLKEDEKYCYFLYPDGSRDNSQEGCGIAFSILFDVCDEAETVQMLRNTHRSKHGLVSIWPPFEGISSEEKPIRHNNLIWPVVNGFFIQAAAKAGAADIVGQELVSQAELALKNDGFWEIYNPETGLPDGGWQIGQHWNSVENQTWSATGFLGGLVFGVFGIRLTEEGIAFQPCLPEKVGPVQLKGIRFRNLILDICLKGEGAKIASIQINGEERNKISYKESGRYMVEITCKNEMAP